MKILLVDDSELLRVRLIKLLHETGTFHILEATNCAEGLAKFSEFAPDAVVLDIALPDESGIILLKKINILNASVPVIMFTNFPTSQFREICLHSGASFFFDKSKDFKEVLQTLLDLHLRTTAKQALSAQK